MSGILANHPAQNLTRAEANGLRIAVMFWLGNNQRDGGINDVQAARDLKRRLEVVVEELKGKPADLTWRYDAIDVRSLRVIREALTSFPAFTTLKEKFQ